MKNAIIIILCGLILLSGCGKVYDNNADAEGDNMGIKRMQKIEFKTEDGFTIKGNLYESEKNAVLMLHQFSLDKSTYDSLAKKFQDANYTALAIDLRGHGESLDKNGVKLNYNSFSESDFRSMELDVKAAKEHLEKNGYDLKVLIGASIGANTVVNYASRDDSIEKIVLLSPGMNYKGIDIEKNAPNVTAKALVIASEEDAYSFGSSKALVQLMPNAKFRGLKNAGHGTKMFGPTNIEKEIIEWVLPKKQ
jgi:alpha-beta hydrolase superfamily lysophospholipase